jgi:hypothetical protein
MGKYAILVLLGAIIAMSYIVLSSGATSLNATENVQERFARRQLQCLSTSFANEAACRLMKIKEMAHYEIDSVKVKYNYTRSFTDADLGPVVILVVTQNNKSTGMADSLMAGEFRITCTARQTKTRLYAKTVVTDYKKPLSAYGWFINADMTGYLGKGENVYGPFHVNGIMRVQNDGVNYPILDGVVTCTNHLRKGGTTTILDGTFPGLTHTNNNFTSPTMSMPDLGVSTEQRALSINLDTKVAGSADLYVKLDNSTVRVYTDAAMTAQAWSSAVTSVANSTIYSANRNLHIQGTLTGKLTVSTDKILYIDGDTKYSDASLSGQTVTIPSTSQNFLGLIAERKVVISTRQIPYMSNGNYYNANGCFITASVYTKKRSTDASSTGAMEMENFIKVPGTSVYRIYPTSSTTTKYAWKQVLDQDRGNFYVYGGRIQSASLVTWAEKNTTTDNDTDGSGADAAFNWGSQGFCGFKEVICHDQRFLDVAPPAFPNIKTNILNKWTETL